MLTIRTLSILILIPIGFFVYGMIVINPKWYEKLLRWQNEIKGTKTEITPETLKFGKVIGIVLLFAAFFFSLPILAFLFFHP